MKRLIIILLLLFAFGSSTQNYLFGQNSLVSNVTTNWKRIKCPFDASKAMLPVICGRLTVPENYNDPDGRMIEIAFMMVKAKKNTDPDHPVLFLNGGPGQTSLYFAETLVTNPLINNVVVDRDWVFFDQRGTGRSSPQLYCMDEKDNPFDLKKCRDNLIKQGIDLSQYNSANIARDMEELRKALGVNQWNLWGISYGSRLALTMARYFPSSVHSIVHDAPGLPEGHERVDDALGLDAALNRLFTKCVDDPDCSARFPQLRNRFVKALTRLRQQPINAGEKQFDDASVIGFIFNWIYPRGYSTYEQRIQNLLIFMDAVARGDSTLMVETQLKMRQEEGLDKPRPPEPIYARYSIGQNMSVYCNEREPFETWDEYQSVIAKSEIARSFLQGFGDPSDCGLWPSGEAEQIENTHVYYD
ncbi:MAG: alpha/beta fold hydrolase, partial [Flavobacteriaceae bacterium]|nr:alpha/beta fold hydrolase [Flavobacteriaceae bacterium]